MFGAVGAFPHTLCERKTLARLACAWTLTHSTSFLSTSAGNLRELHLHRIHYTSFSFDCIRQTSSKMTRKGLPPHTSLLWESLKDLLHTEFWNHWNEPFLFTWTIFFPRFLSSWICVLFPVLSNLKLETVSFSADPLQNGKNSLCWGLCW